MEYNDKTPDRVIDCAIAEHVLGFHVENIGRPILHGYPYKADVLLFFAVGHPHVVYSYDDNSCNAMMYRNGVDDTDGTAPSLPSYCNELNEAWEIVAHMQTDPQFANFYSYIMGPGFWQLDSAAAARAICLAALMSKGIGLR